MPDRVEELSSSYFHSLPDRIRFHCLEWVNEAHLDRKTLSKRKEVGFMFTVGIVVAVIIMIGAIFFMGRAVKKL